MKTSIAFLACMLGAASARMDLRILAEMVAANETINDAPPCAKTAKCTNSSWAGCTKPALEYPGFDVTALVSNTTQKSGPYDIINCGNETSTVQKWIKAAQSAASLAINDSDKAGIDSKYGFEAFFETNSSIGVVQELFGLIKTGFIPFQSGCFGGAPPAAICVNNNAGIPASLRDACDTKGPLFASTDYPSAVIVCPDLFDYPDLSDPRVKCPSYSKGNLTVDDSFSLNSEVLFFNALVWNYLGSGYYYSDLDDVKTAISVDARNSIYNAPNYAYYANGMWFSVPFPVSVDLLIYHSRRKGM